MNEMANSIIVDISYINGPVVSISNTNNEHNIKFIDLDKDEIVYSTDIKNNMWTKPNRKWFTRWGIKIDDVIVDEMNLYNKNIRINIDSNTLGDTIAWVPYLINFSEYYKCNVYASTYYNYLFEDLEIYKNIKFISFNEEISNLYSRYNIGWYRKDDKWEAFDKYPNPVNQIPLQQTATDILGLEYRELNYGININNENIKIDHKYVVFAPQSTAGLKQWPHKNWQILCGMFIERGYEVVIISKDRYHIDNAINIWGKSLNTALNYLKGAEYFIGLGSGLSWANWAMGNWTYMINGFSEEGHEFNERLTKITNNKCIKCWNDPVHTFDRGDWNWCPVYKGSILEHICQTSITPTQVINSIRFI